MNREILFKAKRKNWRELPKEQWWVEGLLWKKKYKSDKWYISCFPDKDDNEELYLIDSETICQYTGITDKNNKKIFENDIIETITFGFTQDHFVTSVKFGAKFSMQGFYLDNGRSMFYFGQSDLTKMDDTKVIGNVFDNPELLINLLKQ